MSKPNIKEKFHYMLSLFELNITMRDELLASEFCQRLLSTISEFYINAKTKSSIKKVKNSEFWMTN